MDREENEGNMCCPKFTRHFLGKIYAGFCAVQWLMIIRTQEQCAAQIIGLPLERKGKHEFGSTNDVKHITRRAQERRSCKWEFFLVEF
jgi:hypothetical protein